MTRDRDFIQVRLNGRPYVVEARRRRPAGLWRWLPAILIPLLALVATAVKLLER